MRSAPLWTWLWLAIASSLGACGGAGEPCGEGQDGIPPLVAEGENFDTYWISSVGINERDVRTHDASHDTLVQAHFSDMTHYQVTVSDRLPFSESCFVYTNKPVLMRRCQPVMECTEQNLCPEGYGCLDGSCFALRTPCTTNSDCPAALICEEDGLCASERCDASPVCPNGTECSEGKALTLRVDSVTFRGLTGGDLTLTPDPAHDYAIAPEQIPQRGFAAAAVDVEVASSDGDRFFPAFSSQVEAPEFPVLTRLDEMDDPDLVAAPSLEITEMRDRPLMVKWQKSEADYVEFKIVPGAGTTTEWVKLRCVTYDDGCLEVPAEALNYLARDTASNFRLFFERHNVVVQAISEAGVTRGVLVLDASAELESVVQR